MGEIADMMIDGTMCSGCGEWMDDGEDGPGFPQYCPACSNEDAPAPKAQKKKAKRKEDRCPATVDALHQSITDACRSIIENRMGGRMKKKTRKAFHAHMQQLLKGFLNVGGVVVHKEFEGEGQ